jgi:TatD DNase family protein
MTMTFFDSHAHLCDDALYPEIDDILGRAKEAHVAHIANICTDAVTLERGLKLRERYSWVHNVASTTPHTVETNGESFFPIVEAAAKRGDLVAIGESGLDYFYYKDTKESQQHYLRLYLRLALETNLPIVIHCRDAFEDFFKILDAEYMLQGKHASGVLHCFTGSMSEAEEVIRRGWFLSLSGIATFKKSHTLHEVAKMVPLESLLIETDAPYLAPQGHRGKRNEPSYIAETASWIAQLKGIPLETLVTATSKNAHKFFKL